MLCFSEAARDTKSVTVCYAWRAGQRRLDDITCADSATGKSRSCPRVYRIAFSVFFWSEMGSFASKEWAVEKIAFPAFRFNSSQRNRCALSRKSSHVYKKLIPSCEQRDLSCLFVLQEEKEEEE